MKIPDNFKSQIAVKFYDKEIVIYDVSDSKDDHYWARKSHTTKVTGSFFGNINFSKLDRVAQDYGIEEQIDATITTSEAIENDTIIGYIGRQYKVIRSIPFDTHYLLIAQLFKAKSASILSV
jgi:hypothetical protein